MYYGQHSKHILRRTYVWEEEWETLLNQLTRDRERSPLKPRCSVKQAGDSKPGARRGTTVHRSISRDRPRKTFVETYLVSFESFCFKWRCNSSVAASSNSRLVSMLGIHVVDNRQSVTHRGLFGAGAGAYDACGLHVNS